MLMDACLLIVNANSLGPRSRDVAAATIGAGWQVKEARCTSVNSTLVARYRIVLVLLDLRFIYETDASALKTRDLWERGIVLQSPLDEHV
jgi:hypothetical protein